MKLNGEVTFEGMTVTAWCLGGCGSAVAARIDTTVPGDVSRMIASRVADDAVEALAHGLGWDTDAQLCPRCRADQAIAERFARAVLP